MEILQILDDVYFPYYRQMLMSEHIYFIFIYYYLKHIFIFIVLTTCICSDVSSRPKTPFQQASHDFTLKQVCETWHQ